MLNTEKVSKFKDWLKEHGGCMQLYLGVHLHGSKEKEAQVSPSLCTTHPSKKTGQLLRI